MRRAVEIFKSRIAYRTGKKSYLESVNQFSDRSLEEIKLLFMTEPPHELARSPRSKSAPLNDPAQVQQDRKRWSENLKR